MFFYVTITMIPGEDAWIISGLKFATSEIILGLSARESGTFWYQGQGKLQRELRTMKKGKKADSNWTIIKGRKRTAIKVHDVDEFDGG